MTLKLAPFRTPSATPSMRFGAGALGPALIDLIEMSKLAKYASGQVRGLILRFEKFPPDMGVAAHEGDVWFVEIQGPTRMAPLIFIQGTFQILCELRQAK